MPYIERQFYYDYPLYKTESPFDLMQLRFKIIIIIIKVAIIIIITSPFFFSLVFNPFNFQIICK